MYVHSKYIAKSSTSGGRRSSTYFVWSPSKEILRKLLSKVEKATFETMTSWNYMQPFQSQT